ncbi:hypothetical protein TCON_2494 [Astathelohania contejeani]|uniref:Uncharacterized protein n=1 Tax=Astathelohania contejeani TaxID=164912 RepID=A0ABQ7HVX0_9MICR|nr:hypothetical protein TCON_2494 [Thelohania contejeani]
MSTFPHHYNEKEENYYIYPRKYGVFLSITNKIQMWDRITKWRNSLQIKVEFLQKLNPMLKFYEITENNIGKVIEPDTCFLLILDNVSSIMVRETFANLLINLEKDDVIRMERVSIFWPTKSKIEEFYLEKPENISIIFSMNDWERSELLLSSGKHHPEKNPPIFTISYHHMRLLSSLKILVMDGIYDSEKIKNNLLNSWINKENPIYPQEVLPEDEYIIVSDNSHHHTTTKTRTKNYYSKWLPGL